VNQTPPYPLDRTRLAPGKPLGMVALGKPGGIDGNEVERYFLEGRIKEADYCEADVVNT
jgi:hypothetical protein